MKNNRLLGLIVAMQSLILLGQWAGSATLVSPARADSQLPNPSERQIAMLDELRTLNGKMDRLISLLQGGEVQVKVARSDEANKPAEESTK